MDKIIKIDDQEVTFRATARTPRLYRSIIGRDMIVDMNKLQKAYTDKQKGEIANFDILDLQIFEDTAFIMAYQANPDMKEKTADEWLDTFEMFSIYEVLPQILDLWLKNTKTTSSAKKK